MTKKTKIILGIVIWTVAAALIAMTIILFVKLKPFGPENKNGISSGFGNVVCRDGDIYFWKYSKDSFSSKNATFGDYSFRPDATNQLVCRNENGEENVIITANGAGNICVAGDRIFYQILQDDYCYLSTVPDTFKLKSCSLTGDDTKDHGKGTLLGIIADGKYLITSQEQGVFSIDTSTLKEKLISDGSFLICAEDTVICFRSNKDSLETEITIYTVSGDGSATKDLYTEKAPKRIGQYEINVPFIVNNKLFYIFEFVSGSFSQARSSEHIISIDLNSGEVNALSGCVQWQMGSYFDIDIVSDDEDVIAFKDYISDPKKLTIKDKNDYSDFSEADTSYYENDQLLNAGYCETVRDKEYIFLTCGNYVDYSGWRTFFRFEKCSLFQKDLKTGECIMIYSSADPIYYSDAPETNPITIKTGEEIDCGNFLFTTPDTWNVVFAYKIIDESIWFYFDNTNKPIGDNTGFDDWRFGFSLNIVDVPESKEQTCSSAGNDSVYYLAKLTQGNEKKLIEAKYLSISADSEYDYDNDNVINCVEMLRDGLKAKPGTEIELLDYSDLDGTAWYTMTDDGTVINFNVYDVKTNHISAKMSVDGYYNTVKITVRMHGNDGNIYWTKSDDSAQMLSEYFDDSYSFGYGSIELADNNRLIITVSGGNDLDNKILDGLTFVSVFVPRDDETEYISGKIKERCDYFEISLPDWWEGVYSCRKTADSISLYHTKSMKTKGYGEYDGFYGFLFSLSIEEPDEYNTDSWWWQVATRRLITDDNEKFICLYIEDGADVDGVAKAYTEQYKAMSKTIDAIIATIKPTNPNAKLEKFDIGFTSEKYTGTNEAGDRFDWILTYETDRYVSGELMFYPASGEKNVTLNASCRIYDGQYHFSYSNYDDNLSVHQYGEGDIEFDGNTIRLNLTDESGDTQIDEGGVITLTAKTG